MLTVENFRGFKAERWRFHESLNVIVGDNGTGRSALLDAMAIGVGSFFLGVDGASARAIESDDVRRVGRAIGDQWEELPGCTDLRFREREGELVAIFHDGRRLPPRILSDGFRTILGLASDLAWRCATLNPHLGDRATRDTPGVVLVDEIDLHLHPNRQQRVLGDRRRSFPCVQFFITTHSPFIVQSVSSESVVALSGPMHLEKAPYLRGIEEVVTDVMGVAHAARSERFTQTVPPQSVSEGDAPLRRPMHGGDAPMHGPRALMHPGCTPTQHFGAAMRACWPPMRPHETLLRRSHAVMQRSGVARHHVDAAIHGPVSDARPLPA